MELRQKADLKANITQERKEFIRMVLAQDEDLDIMLEELVDDVDSLIKDNSRNDKIQDKDRISLALPVLFAAFSVGYINLIKDYNRDAADLKAGAIFEKISTKYPDLISQKWVDRVEAYPDQVERQLLFRKYPVLNGKTIGSLIKTIEKSSIDTVRSILIVGVREGKSAQQIASDIEMYIRPLPNGARISPFQWVRDRFGRTKVAAISSGRIRAGSISHNAYRIARTEINNTYTRATLELNKGAPWIKGYRWVLSPSHPKHDTCDTYANKGIYKYGDVPERPHPFCMCDIHEVLVPISEL